MAAHNRRKVVSKVEKCREKSQKVEKSIEKRVMFSLLSIICVMLFMSNVCSDVAQMCANRLRAVRHADKR